MKRLSVALVIFIMLFAAATSYAATVTGTVKDGTGKLLQGVKVTYKFVSGSISVYTNSFGKYKFYHPNWCDSPVAVFKRPGYIPVSVQVCDGTCWGCYPECDPGFELWGCATTIGRSVIMLKNPLVPLAQDKSAMTESNEIALPLLGLYMATFCQFNVCDYDCLYQFVEDVMNGPEYMFGQKTRPDIELAPCPDVVTFVDFVNNWLDAMHDYFYGDNFPEE